MMTSAFELAFAILKEYRQTELGEFFPDDVPLLPQEPQQPSAEGGSREEHLHWSKERALAYLPAIGQALNSLASDVAKHPETERLVSIIMQQPIPRWENQTEWDNRDWIDDTRRFIEGFN